MSHSPDERQSCDVFGITTVFTTITSDILETKGTAADTGAGEAGRVRNFQRTDRQELSRRSRVSVPWIGTNAIDATTTVFYFTQVSGFGARGAGNSIKPRP